jgi:hypothetical protein
LRVSPDGDDERFLAFQILNRDLVAFGVYGPNDTRFREERSENNFVGIDLKPVLALFAPGAELIARGDLVQVTNSGVAERN